MKKSVKSVVLSILVLIIIIVDFIVLYYNGSEIGNLILENKEEKVVTKIIDGDTVIVEGGETIRLLGIDCDERGKECYVEAKNKIEEVLLDKTVVLERDGEDEDIYNRKLRYIFLNGENINNKMVADGFCVARFVGDFSKYRSQIVKSEQEAINNKIGCKWS
ncbi:MAG TPA: thermonuclease family protein [Candidatus Nanoarchaeia archaeon]|nr:thermonuclease family protein [Candidatus Nanoarchaeia archaeon]